MACKKYNHDCFHVCKSEILNIEFIFLYNTTRHLEHNGNSSSKNMFCGPRGSHLNALGLYTTCCHSLLGPTVWYPLLCMQEREMLHVAC